MTNQANQQDRLFVGVYPCGLVFADRSDESSGDYARLAFLSYDTLKLDLKPTCPADLRARIEQYALDMKSKRGEEFQISTCGQTVRLGRLAQPEQALA